MNKNRIEITSYFAAQQMISHKSNFGRKICGIYRSEYERRFARCLEVQKVPFSFERFAFKLLNESGVYVHYIPDFHITNTSLFIEIQNSSPCRNRKHQILMFQEQYKDLTLMLLRKDDVKKYIDCKFDIDFDLYKNKEEINA